MCIYICVYLHVDTHTYIDMYKRGAGFPEFRSFQAWFWPWRALATPDGFQGLLWRSRCHVEFPIWRFSPFGAGTIRAITIINYLYISNIYLCIYIYIWWFPEIGVPPVIIHFRWGFSLTKTIHKLGYLHFFGNHQFNILHMVCTQVILWVPMLVLLNVSRFFFFNRSVGPWHRGP